MPNSSAFSWNSANSSYAGAAVMRRSRVQDARSVQPKVPFLHLPSMRGPYLTSTAFRRLTLVNVVLLAAIIVSGAVVRLTNSGLGCADWPNCSATKIVDVSDQHAAIEQVNRIFPGAIGVPLAPADRKGRE